MPESDIHVIDDDEAVRDSLAFVLETSGMTVRTYESALEFLEQLDRLGTGCIITDIRMPDMNGLDLIRRLKERGVDNPMIVITGHGDVPLAVEAMKAGVIDFLEKPFDEEALIRAIGSARAHQSRSVHDLAERRRLKTIFESLSQREREVLQGVVEGKMNKVIAHELGISHRTVDVYRANVMAKTGANGLSDLVRMVLTARD
ncbi:MAG: response regulator [Caulobacteraceae bacterium]|nr:response regulator [Caulobacteraceae bacterium]